MHEFVHRWSPSGLREGMQEIGHLVPPPIKVGVPIGNRGGHGEGLGWGKPGGGL